MKSNRLRTLSLAIFLTSAGLTSAQAPSDQPRPIPLTRPELKRQIEDVKVRVPRIPLPELTDAEREQLGQRATNYESRLRHHYLAGGDTANRNRPTGGSPRDRNSRPQDPKMTLANSFKVELFWIVSRTNNCQYCLGHQESKLLAAGLSEDRIASLDGDWKNFSPAERAAYAFARKYTYQPHLLDDEDIASLKEHFNDSQILEMMLSMAGNNSINRWKEGVGVPQNATEGGYSRVESSNETGNSQSLPRGTYLTPTSPEYESAISRVAPVALDSATGQPTSSVVCVRPELESRAEVERKLQQCRERQSRLALADEATTRKVFNLESDRPLTQWHQLMANFPLEGVRRALSLTDADQNSDLNPKLKAQISWIVARYDRAWYAVNDARNRLRAEGCSDDEIFQLDGNWSEQSASDQALFVVARNLAASPVILTDSQVERAVKLAGPAAVVQTINYVTHRAAFNRLTEAAGLGF